MESENSAVEIMEYAEKSICERKQYRIIRLANDMKVMLVHDDQVHEDDYEVYWPICCLAISVGSLSDPDDLPGLARYVAHMLYYSGTEFLDLNPNDGMQVSNADSDGTTFTLRSRINSLDKTLKHLAQLMKEPLNMRETMAQKREVFKEYIEIASVFRASDRLFPLLGNFGHPSRNSGWGKMETLTNEKMNDDTFYRRIEEFKNRHYSAHRMSLCLETHLSLDEMQEIVVTRFSSIPNNKLPGVDFTPFTHENAFQAKFHENVYCVEGKKYDQPKIVLTWCVPPENPAFKCQPYYFLRYIMKTTHLNEGKRKFHFHPAMQTNGIFSLFTIEIVLTEDSMSDLDDVIEAIFSYTREIFEKLKQSEQLEQLYRDFVNVTNWPLFYEAERHEIVKYLTTNLMYYIPENNSTDKYDPVAIREAIDTLSKGNFNILIVSPQTEEFEMKDESCRLEYTERKIPDNWISLWNNPKMFIGITLPAPNPYVANDFTIFYDGSQSTPKYPTKVYESDVSELWYRQDDTFLLPTACCYFYFKTPIATSSIENSTMLMLLGHILNFGNKIRMPYLHSLCHFYDTDGGLVLKVFGPNQKQHLIVDDVTEKLINLHINVTEEEFRKAIQHEWDTNHVTFELASDDFAQKNIIRIGHVSSLDKFRCSESIAFIDMQNFCHKFFTQMKIFALIQGNFTEEQAISIMEMVETKFDCEKIDEQKTMVLSARILPQGAYYLSVQSFDRTQYKSGALNYYQIGPNSVRARPLIALLLRLSNHIEATEKLPNSSCSWKLCEDGGILGYSITICSREDEKRADLVAECFEEWHKKMILLIASVPAELFQHCVECLTYDRIAHTMTNEVDRNWLEIVSGEYMFDRHQQEIEVLSTISPSELLQFYRDHSGANECKLSIQCIGYSEETGLIGSDTEPKACKRNNAIPDEIIYAETKTPKSGIVIRNIDEFKESLEVYSK